MLTRILSIRGPLKTAAANKNPIELVIGELVFVVLVTKINLFSIEVDYLDDDLVTSLQTGVIFMGDITSIRSLSTELLRISLIINNPDLAIDTPGPQQFNYCEETEEED